MKKKIGIGCLATNNSPIDYQCTQGVIQANFHSAYPHKKTNRGLTEINHANESAVSEI